MSVGYGKGLHILHGCVEERVGCFVDLGWRSDTLCVKEVEETGRALCYSLFRVDSYNASSKTLEALSCGVKI
jgi:hypothetical protein